MAKEEKNWHVDNFLTEGSRVANDLAYYQWARVTPDDVNYLRNISTQILSLIDDLPERTD